MLGLRGAFDSRVCLKSSQGEEREDIYRYDELESSSTTRLERSRTKEGTIQRVRRSAHSFPFPLLSDGLNFSTPLFIPARVSIDSEDQNKIFSLQLSSRKSSRSSFRPNEKAHPLSLPPFLLPTSMSLRRLLLPIFNRPRPTPPLSRRYTATMPVSEHTLSPPQSPAPPAKKQKLDESASSTSSSLPPPPPPPSLVVDEQPVASTSTLPEEVVVAAPTRAKTTVDYRNKAVLAPMVRSGNLPNVSRNEAHFLPSLRIELTTSLLRSFSATSLSRVRSRPRMGS